MNSKLQKIKFSDKLLSSVKIFYPKRTLLVSREWKCEVRHTLREGNICADILAKRGPQENRSCMRMR